MSRPRPHVQRTPSDIEDRAVGAHEHDDIPVVGTGEGHLDPGSSAGLGGQFDLEHVSEQAMPVSGPSEQVDAGLPDVANGVVGEVGNDDGNADLLGAGRGNGDGKIGGIVGGDKPAAYFHFVECSCKKVPIDWSPLDGRKVVVHPDQEAA